MILIADSGSTKTDWVYLESEHKTISFSSVGLHPSFHKSEEIHKILKDTFPADLDPKMIYFYGAGCGSEKNKAKIKICLIDVFPNAEAIQVESDLLGASRSLFQSNSGITCILGTGSNSCYYDGEKNHKNFPSLGYILGDEGSGADLGKRFLKANFSGQLSTEINIQIEKEFGTLESILDRINNGKHPNRYLASFAKFLADYKDNTEIKTLIEDAFEAYIKSQILIYPESNLYPVGFVGSIANSFQKELNSSLNKFKLNLARIETSPINGLMKFHRK